MMKIKRSCRSYLAIGGFSAILSLVVIFCFSCTEDNENTDSSRKRDGRAQYPNDDVLYYYEDMGDWPNPDFSSTYKDGSVVVKNDGAVQKDKSSSKLDKAQIKPDTKPVNLVVNTIAGIGESGNIDGPATTTAKFKTLAGIAVDNSGKIYVADESNHRIRLIEGGQVKHFAGSTSAEEGSDDGTVANATFNRPSHLALDNKGKIYVADTSNYKIRLIENGQVTTLAGNKSSGCSASPVGTTAKFDTPNGLALSSNGQYLYIADTGCNNIFVVDTQNSLKPVSILVSSSAGISAPMSLAISSDDKTLYLVENKGYKIKAIDIATKKVSVIAGSTKGYKDDVALSAQFQALMGIAIDGSGRIFVVDNSDHRIRILWNGAVNTYAGTGAKGFTPDNTAALSAQFSFPYEIAIVGSKAYITDRNNYRIRVILPQ